nr:putative late blight resistance protein homolog R1B-14 [Ipomoea trifida]
MEFEIQRPTPRVLPDDLQQLRTLLQNLATLQAFLDKYYIKAYEDAEIKQVEVNIKSFALESENKLEIQLRNILLAKDAKRKEDACRELHRSIGEIGTHLDSILSCVIRDSDIMFSSLFLTTISGGPFSVEALASDDGDHLIGELVTAWRGFSLLKT